MYFITTKRMLEVCFSAHPNIQYRTSIFCADNRYTKRCIAAARYRAGNAPLSAYSPMNAHPHQI